MSTGRDTAQSATVLTSPRGLIRSGIVVGLAIAGANGMNALFQLLLARLLTPDEYSLLASLLAVVLIFTVPAAGLQATVARAVAKRIARGDPAAAGLVLREALHSLVRVGLGAGAVAGVLAYPLALLLHVTHPLPVVATAVALAASVALPISWGGLQGADRFVALGALQLGYSAIRLGAGLALAAAGAGVAGVMFGVAVAAVFTAVVSFVTLGELWRAGRALPLRGGIVATRYAGGAAIGLTMFVALTSVDLLVARTAFPPHVRGAYAAASVGARTLLLLPIAVTTVLFPRVSTLDAPLRERRHLLAGLAAVGGVGAIATAVLFAFPGQLLNLVFGHEYMGAKAWLGPLSLAMLLYALVNVYLFHFLALGRERFAAVLAAVLLVQVPLYGFLHGRPAELVAIQIGSAAVLVAAGELYDRTRR
jgi:O-antigen/teichoic acid export membrane protein